MHFMDSRIDANVFEVECSGVVNWYIHLVNNFIENMLADHIRHSHKCNFLLPEQR